MLSNIPYDEMPEKIEELAGDIERLENNMNELKEYLKGFDLERLRETCEHNLADTIEVLLDKMEKIENKDFNDMTHMFDNATTIEPFLKEIESRK